MTKMVNVVNKQITHQKALKFNSRAFFIDKILFLSYDGDIVI